MYTYLFAVHICMVRISATLFFPSVGFALTIFSLGLSLIRAMICYISLFPLAWPKECIEHSFTLSVAYNITGLIGFLASNSHHPQVYCSRPQGRSPIAILHAKIWNPNSLILAPLWFSWLLLPLDRWCPINTKQQNTILELHLLIIGMIGIIVMNTDLPWSIDASDGRPRNLYFQR